MLLAPHASSRATHSNNSRSHDHASDAFRSNPTCPTISHSPLDSLSEPRDVIPKVNDVANYGALDVLAACFLDPGLFNQMRLELPEVAFAVAEPVAEMVGSVHDINATASLFFDTIHTWMPIISKRLFFQDLPRRLANKRAELFLLILSMQLTCARVTEPKTYSCICPLNSSMLISNHLGCSRSRCSKHLY